MARVQLHDIVGEDDVEAVVGLRRGPGQDRYLGSMISHFEDAIVDARACPRMWAVKDGEQLVGFVMISDGIPPETLAADDPYQPAGTRYFMGEPVNTDNCRRVLREGYQRQRIAAALYLSLMEPGTPLFPTSAPAWRQQRWLAKLA